MAWMQNWPLLFKVCVFIFVCICNASQLPGPKLTTLSVLNETVYKNGSELFRRVTVELNGQNLQSVLKIKVTNGTTECQDDIYNYQIVETTLHRENARFTVIIPSNSNGPLYLCVQERTNPYHPAASDHVHWHHAGPNLVLQLGTTIHEDSVEREDASNNHIRTRRRSAHQQSSTETAAKNSTGELRITGLRVEHSDKEIKFEEDGVPVVLAEMDVIIRVFGTELRENTALIFTDHGGQYGDPCQFPVTGVFYLRPDELRPDTGRVVARLPPGGKTLHVCAKQANGTAAGMDITPFVHQGSEHWLLLRTYQKLLPIWACIVIIVTCLTFSALFSGLNLGLMSLDRTELKILCNTGNEVERRYARVIQPVRDHGNYLLCSILLGNVLVNSIFTILLDDLTSGFIAVIFSTLAIVMFGEISPQALCSRHGLAVGARTIYITKAVMVITFPLSYPISKILDAILGEEIGNVYNRERLKELVKITTDVNDLDRDEVNIISGALELRKKCVADVMTRIEDVFMLDYEAVLNFETVSEIMKSGFSRIPVFEGSRLNICTVLYIKDLAFVDPDDNTPLKTLCEFYRNPCNFVFEDVTLDVMFKEFKEGNKGHMAFVHRVNNEGEGDPFYETVGLVTLEDVIEELIQAEIMDETDVFTDNRSKRRRFVERSKQDFSMFAERRENQNINISPQLTLAAYQYLSTSVAQFKSDCISETILRRLLKQDIFYHIKKNKDRKHDSSLNIYEQGKPVDFFVLILEGRVEATVGKENLLFESGPFTYFGIQALAPSVGIAESPVAPSTIGSLQSLNVDALIKHTFLPDYSVRAVTDVLYMRVRRALYMAAKRATLMERSQKDNSSEQFDDEMEKLLHSYEDEDRCTGQISPKIPDESKTKTSPKPSSTSPNVSPANASYSRDVNGSAKFSSADNKDIKTEEEVSLLPNNTDKS